MMSDLPRQSFSVREISSMLELSAAQVRGLVADGVLDPERGPRGKYLFTFQDLVTLRAVSELVREGVPTARVRAAVVALRDQIEADRELAEATLESSGRAVVVSVDETTWEPETGQILFELAEPDRPPDVEALSQRRHEESDRSAGEWYVFADQVETTDPVAAEEAYRMAIDLDPTLAEAHLNLGRLLHAAGTVRDALEEYIAARDLDPADATTHYNIGVASQDLGDLAEAMAAYEQAITLAPRFADARYNLAALYEEQGEEALAVQQLKQYRDLVEGR